MVTTPNKQTIPPAPTGLKPNPTRIEPATIVAGAGVANKAPDAANRDKTGESKFTLPDSLSPSEARDNSFKYGGGRSAGNRSLADNAMRKVEEQ